MTRSPSELSSSELNALTYDAEIVGYGEKGKVTTKIRQTPNVGVRTTSGFLVGSSRGEWGGELIYLAGKSPQVRLIDENITGIHPHALGTVVVTGLAHLGLNAGALYLAKLVRPGKYDVSRWKTLPGAPRRSGVMPDGSLFVSCEGGDIVLKADGRMEMAVRAP